MGSLVKDFFAQQQVTGTQGEPPCGAPRHCPPSALCCCLTAMPCTQRLTPDKVYHATVMPCYDKKLEASRPDFFSQEHQTRDVDCVITTGAGPGPAGTVTGSHASLVVSVALETQMK